MNRNLFTGKHRQYAPIPKTPAVFAFFGGAAFGLLLAFMLWAAI